MPIKIYIKDTWEELEWLCDDIWDLSSQMDVLETWLNGKGKNLVPSKYVVDIGFEIREYASGGGAVLSAETMQILGKIGMDIYFSEYPSGTTE